MKDELIALAKEAGAAQTEGYEVLYHTMNPKALERFAALVAAKEREECAIICDGFSSAEYTTGKVDHNEMAWTDHCAAAIRGRK